MNDTLEICTDASIRTYPNGRVFGCSGAYCITTREEDFLISPDTTNNRSEMLAVYIGIKLAERILKQYPGRFSKVYIYSDSQFTVFGLTKWIKSWLNKTDDAGIMYGTNGKPVKNQELFKAIITYCSTNNLHIKLFHQAGHVNCNSTKSLGEANNTFFKSNGFYLRPEDIYKISYYNDYIDNATRMKLQTVDESVYPVMDYSKNNIVMCNYVIPADYYQYIN